MDNAGNINRGEITIESHKVGPGNPSFIIAEIAQAHDGSLGTAHAYIDAVAEAGASAIKFQTHIAMEESTFNESFRIKFSLQDRTRYEYWKRMEFSAEQWHGLAKHAREKGLVFLSSAFSIKAVEILSKIGMAAWKIGSGEVRSRELINAMAKNGAPILLSTGMSDVYEIEKAVQVIDEEKLSFALFQCTTKYPTSFEEVGLNIIGELRKQFKCPVGLSDHSGTVYPALAAMALGANLIEVHVTFDKRLFGPDTIASVTIEDLKLLVEANRAFATMSNNPVNKNLMAPSLLDTKNLFTKSIAPAVYLQKGMIIDKTMLALKKPGTGIPASKMDDIIGKRLSRDVSPERLLKWEDLE